MARVKLYGGAFLLGAIGVLVTLGAWHLWDDHTRLHAIWNLEVQRAQQAAVAPPPK